MSDENLPTISRDELRQLIEQQHTVSAGSNDDDIPVISREDLAQIAQGPGSAREDLVEMLGERVFGAYNDPTTEMKKQAAADLAGAATTAATEALGFGALAAGQESGAALGGTIGQVLAPGPLKPVARLLGAAVGGAGGFGAADAGIDVARGEDVSVRPLDVGLAALASAAPGLLQSAQALGVGEVIGGTAQRMSAYGRRVKDALTRFIDPEGNLPAAFGMVADDFNIKGKMHGVTPKTPADALLRLDRRGVFSEGKANVLKGGVDTGSRFTATDFSQLRGLLQKEKERLVGTVDTIAAPVEIAEIKLDGALGKVVTEIDRGGASVRLGDLEERWSDVAAGYLAKTGTERVARDAEKVVKKETEKLYSLVLDDASLAQRKAAQETVELTERFVTSKALRPMSDVGDSEIMKILGVKYDKKGAVIPESMRRYTAYGEALDAIDETTDMARSLPVRFSDLYKKRISLAKLAQYGPDANSAPITAQVMTDMADAVRGLENSVAQTVDGGTQFLKLKDELSDVLTVEDRVYRAEALSRSPRKFTQPLSFAPSAIVARNVARGMQTSTFRLHRHNIGKLLRGEAQSASPGILQPVALPGVTDKIITASGAVTRSVRSLVDTMAARNTASAMIANSIASTLVYHNFGSRGLDEVTEEELAQLQMDPSTQEMIAQADAAGKQAVASLEQALHRGDEQAVSVEVALLSKQFPSAFEQGNTGIPGEVEIGGVTRFPLPEDAQAFAGRVREVKEIDVLEKAKIINALNENGVVIGVPSAIRPRRLDYDLDLLSSR